MKTRKLLIFLLCFVLLVGALGVVASAKGATETESYTEVKNSDGSVTTSYGKLTSTYASAETYPFGIFRYKNETLQSSEGQKTMKGAFDSAKNWNNTWTKIKKEDGTNAGVNDTENTYRTVIVLRRDYTTTSSDKYDNYAQTQNDVVLDLNGGAAAAKTRQLVNDRVGHALTDGQERKDRGNADHHAKHGKKGAHRIGLQVGKAHAHSA